MSVSMPRLGSFARDTRGNVALLFAVCLLPAVGLVGAAIDCSRASDAKVRVQRAADAAVLAGAKARSLPLSEREALVRKAFESSLGATSDIGNISVAYSESGSLLTVSASASIKNVIMKSIGFDKTSVNGLSQATVGTANEVEVALVLDTTGSMRNDMPALRSSASKLVDLLFDSSSPDKIRVAVVPYVASVNIGANSLPSSFLDHNANSRWHGVAFEDAEIGMIGCNAPSLPADEEDGSGPEGPDEPDSPGGGGGGGGPGKPSGNDKSGSLGVMRTLAAVARELFGVTGARADVTPSTSLPLSGQSYTLKPPLVDEPRTVLVPNGFVYASPCGLINPLKVSHFDLFNRIPGAKWKGCVEARPEPFDVSDDLPTSAKPDTLYVPYFYPDDADVKKRPNNYMSDGSLPSGWDWEDGEYAARANILKYNGVNKANIKEAAPSTTGPNAGCPDEMLPLSGDRTAVLNKVKSLNYWESGGTITSEGVAWGWRALSPVKLFANPAKDYGVTQKIMIIMSDGANSLIADGNKDGATYSEYTAYGVLAGERFPKATFKRAEKYLNDRMQVACANAKAKGIRILTVLYRETSPSAVAAMGQCASSSADAYQAADSAKLEAAFTDIAGKLTELRLIR